MVNDMFLLGIDEAGRGCAIGPLIMGGVLIEESLSKHLMHIGVKDSKKLSRKKRRILKEKIQALAKKTFTVVIEPGEIDSSVLKCGLDRLEARVAAGIIKKAKPSKVIIDAPGRGGRAYERNLRKYLGNTKVKIVCENGADVKYPVVSAASIVAKEKREEEIAGLKENHGDFGSGYSSDAKTVGFIRDAVKKGDPLPACIRMQWKTVKRFTQPYGPLFK